MLMSSQRNTGMMHACMCVCGGGGGCWGGGGVEREREGGGGGVCVLRLCLGQCVCLYLSVA